ncbi:MAG: helix-turn-helix transcriptional regulator [Bacteroidales bacterium]|nr:helix-turn-helix transcriptional regulator [Bacteroidales bacterium]
MAKRFYYISDALVMLMSERKVTYADIERATGVSGSTLSKYRDGTFSAGRDNVTKIAQGFGMTFEEFVALPGVSPKAERKTGTVGLLPRSQQVGIRRVMEIIGRDYISPENRTPVVHVPMEYGPVLSAGGKYVQ